MISGSPSDWVQYSYNMFGGVHYVADATGANSFKTPSEDQSTVIAAQDGRQRKNCPGIGYKYNRVTDMFYEAQPYASWTLNTSTYLWEAPSPAPTDGKNYEWNEETQSWTEIG